MQKAPRHRLPRVEACVCAGGNPCVWSEASKGGGEGDEVMPTGYEIM